MLIAGKGSWLCLDNWYSLREGRGRGEGEGEGKKGEVPGVGGRGMGSKSPSLKYFLCLLPCQQPTYIGRYLYNRLFRKVLLVHTYVHTLYAYIRIITYMYVCV